jgi:hypothetical protein
MRNDGSDILLINANLTSSNSSDLQSQGIYLLMLN